VNHWCHGAPGAIGPLLSAVQLFLKIAESSDSEINCAFAQKLYRAAMKAGELTWQYGILLKGNSLCHGISGNGLLLHSVARWHNLRSAEDAARLELSESAMGEAV